MEDTGKISRKEREKLRREQEIVDAAEKIFVERGYEGASMDAIASKSEYTKRTVYQYFLNKEDLFFAAALRSYEALGRYVEEATREGESGLEKLRNGCFGFYRFFKDHPGKFALITAVGRVKDRAADTPYLNRFLSFEYGLFSSIEMLIREGQDEGSINASRDPKLDSCALAFLLSAFFNMFAMTGRAYLDHFNLDEDGFVEKILGIIIDYARP
jgi:AcrR family transcriptional regulator